MAEQSFSLKTMPTELDKSAIRAASDPSFLSTQHLWREIAALKELMFARLDAAQKAIDVAHDDLVRVPTDVQKQVGALKDLHSERFATIEEKIVAIHGLFKERDTLRDEKFSAVEKTFAGLGKTIEASAASSKTAVDAALQAAKEAVGKSEVATTKTIDQLGLIIQSGNKATDEKIDDVKDRLTRIESRAEGGADSIKDRHAAGGFNFGLVGMIVGVLGFLTGLVILIVRLQ